MTQAPSNLQDFLQESGVLKTGDDAAIAKAKAEWRKIYNQKYQKQYFKRRKVFRGTMSPTEYKLIKKVAKEVFDLSVPQFLLQAGLEKAGSHSMQAYPNHYAEMLQSLGNFRDVLIALRKESKGYVSIYQMYEASIRQVEQMQAKLLGL